MERGFSRRVRLVTSVALALLAVVLNAGVVPAASSAAKPIRFLSTYESSSRSVSRDVGISVALPDKHDLWFFGDTSIYRHGPRGWRLDSFIDGGTAAEARSVPGSVPRGGEFPATQPTRFLPVPRDVYLPDGSGRLCTNRTASYAARWITGAAPLPNDRSELLITYSESCVQHGGQTITPEGWGYLLYDWRHRRIVHGPVDVFRPNRSGAALPSAWIFVSPVSEHGLLTLFSSACTEVSPYGTCLLGQAWSVTLPATSNAMDNRASYQLQALPIDLPQTWTPFAVTVNRYPTGWRLVETTSLYGWYSVFAATQPAGPWQLLRSGTLPGCPAHHGLCWSIQGHPELSTRTRMLISYTDPDALPGGHIVLTTLPA